VEERVVGRGMKPKLDVDRESTSRYEWPCPGRLLATGLSVKSPPPAAAFFPISSVFSVTTNPFSAELSTAKDNKHYRQHVTSLL